MSQPRKKLIEVSLPLEAINVASAREKSVRNGHPSTLHLWWARRPLAACRAVIFGQLVDDPGAWPDRFPTPEAEAVERERLHQVIREMVEWPSSDAADQARWQRALAAARFEIARSTAWGRGEEPPKGPEAVRQYLNEYAPPIYDPFSGGGSIPLEAQRLGLRAYGSDLNPVAVLISKALVEIPPKYAGRPAVHPQVERSLTTRTWKGAEGLAEDIRRYGGWMREQAQHRLGGYYPEAPLPGGRKGKVIAWLWARTVRSPDPAARGAMVPLTSSFILSTKASKQAILLVIRDSTSADGWRFEVKQAGVSAGELAAAKLGTKSAKAGSFVCVLTGSPIERGYIQAEGKADRLGKRLMAVVVEGDRSRIYLTPTFDDEKTELLAGENPVVSEARNTYLKGSTPTRAMITGGVCSAYGLRTWGHLFTDRQLLALSTLSDLIVDVRENVVADYRRNLGRSEFAAAAPSADNVDIEAASYANAISTYLALALDRCVMGANSLTRWNNIGEKAQHAFGRQAFAMVWDFAETNPLADATGSWASAFEMAANALNGTNQTFGQIDQGDATENGYAVSKAVFSTDPPYYDNVAYAVLSDFFYAWLRRPLAGAWSDLVRRIETPKSQELIAAPYLRGGKEEAEDFFLDGMSKAIVKIRSSSEDDYPFCFYYAFKQSEKSVDGVSSPGWATFLQALVDAGLMIDGTWPIRTEMATRMVASGASALQSSIVHVCRPRPSDAPTATRRDFMGELRRELPADLARMRSAGVHPVDIPQSALGPGMAVFSKYAVVREADDSPMRVSRAITLINQVRGEITHADSGDLDALTRFALDWFEPYGWNAKPAGEAIKLSQSYDLTEKGLREAGVLVTERGDARLLQRSEMNEGWRPSRDRTLTAWELAQALNRALNDGGGVSSAGAVLAEARQLSSAVQWLTGRLFAISEDRRMTDEARGWGRLSEAWDAIEAAADRTANPTAAPTQIELL